MFFYLISSPFHGLDNRAFESNKKRNKHENTNKRSKQRDNKQRGINFEAQLPKEIQAKETMKEVLSDNMEVLNDHIIIEGLSAEEIIKMGETVLEIEELH